MDEQKVAEEVSRQLCLKFIKEKLRHIRGDLYEYTESEEFVHRFRMHEKNGRVLIYFMDGHYILCCGMSCDYYGCDNVSTI